MHTTTGDIISPIGRGQSLSKILGPGSRICIRQGATHPDRRRPEPSVPSSTIWPGDNASIEEKNTVNVRSGPCRTTPSSPSTIQLPEYQQQLRHYAKIPKGKDLDSHKRTITMSCRALVRPGRIRLQWGPKQANDIPRVRPDRARSAYLIRRHTDLYATMEP